MFVAVVVAALTLVVAVIVLVVVLSLRNKHTSAGSGQKKRVQAISSVGVASSLNASSKHKNASARISSSESSSKKVMDNLKPRLAVVGVMAAAVFGSLVAKLWSMQILTGSTYKQEANDNKYTRVSTPAPRGYIYDADGVALVKNRASLTVLASAEVADDRDVLLRLSTVLGIPYAVVRQRIQNTDSGSQSQRVVESDASLRAVAFIAEHGEAFPDVTVETRTIREYPYGALAAHVLGYTGTVSADDLQALPEGRGVKQGDDMGKSGVEQQYDNLLAGDHGQRTVVARADGKVVDVVSETQPTRGSDLRLSIKAPVQYVCDKALAALIAPKEGVIGTGKGCAGAAVVLDVRDGGIVALSSYPTYSPDIFIGGISSSIWDLYKSDKAYTPLLNRAIAGEYPAASTYKAFTGLAALENGFTDTTISYNCTGKWDGWNTGLVQKCWLHSGHGHLNFRGGVVNSCDTVFYEIGKKFFDAGKTQGGSASDTALQEVIKKYGFGKESGIDLGGEAVGRVPTPQWRAEHFKDFPEEAAWKGGYMTNMAIGQGDVLVTPIQIAVAYAAVATGKLLKPHVLKEVTNAEGEVSYSFDTQARSSPDIRAEHLDIMRDALHGVANENPDTAASFRKFKLDPQKIACKTGTGEVTNKEDYAWFVCYAPYDDPKYVVACLVEQGGGGSAVGVPLGAEILAAVMAADEGSLTTVDKVAGSTGKSQELPKSGSGRTD